MREKSKKSDIQLWFSSLYSIGARAINRMKENNIDCLDLFNMPDYDVYTCGLFSKEQINEILKTRTIDYIKNLKHQMSKYGARFVSQLQVSEKLQNIPNSPRGLFTRGCLLNEDKPSIAIIGSRKPTEYGLKNAYELGYLLSHYFTIVSGMALGIDEQAHIGCLDAGNYSIGVLGSGVDKLYPIKNFKTYMRMIEQGTLVSEYTMGISPKPWHFPMRNRIISGLADALIVVEAKIHSGTSLTVEAALEQGCEVFAIPGRIDDENSLGCNKLIKDGANIITDYVDILEYFGLKKEGLDKPPSKFDIVLNNISSKPFSINDILELEDISISDLSTLINEMEVKGIIRPYTGGFYIKNSKI